MLSYTYQVIETNTNLPVHFELVRCPETTIPAHWHDHLEILYLKEGDLTAVVQAESYKLMPGEMMIMNSRELHMTQSYGDSVYILLQIPLEHIRQFFPEFEFLRFQTLITQSGSGHKVFHCIQEMLRIYQKQEHGYQLLFIGSLYELLFYLCKDFSVSPMIHKSDFSGRDFQRITQIMEWVRSNFKKPLSLNQAADLLGLSREYFCRLFKKYTGQTFLDYVTAVRTMHLYDGLITTGESISHLMEQNGITNYKVFMRTFKMLYGTTPQKIRRENRTKIVSATHYC